jgi:hypothetical protein
LNTQNNPRPALAIFDRSYLLICAAAAIVCVSICIKSARHVEILWDEQVDHDIAVDLRDHPLGGSAAPLDASQTRLPMYACALAYAITGRDDLVVARNVSAIAGGLTVFLTGILARRLFCPLVGALAAILTGISPYFICFARIAMTEGDVFYSLFVTLAVLAFVHDLRSRTARSWLIASVALGLAIGAKLFAIFLPIVYGIGLFATRPVAAMQADSGTRNRRLTALLAVGCGAGVVTLLLGQYGQALAIVGWGLAALVWLIIVTRVWTGKLFPEGRIAALMGMMVLGAFSCGVLLPVQLTENQIAREILRRTLRWDQRLPLALWSDHLRLYAGILMVKLTPPLGVITCAALIFAAFREREDGRWRLPVLSVVFCVVLVCFLPLRQTFYLMGVYPLLMIITSAFMVEVGGWLGKNWPVARGAWAVLMAALVLHLGLWVWRSYPYYNLHGYQWVGNKWLGAESRGYRNLIQTPSDGVESLIKWCDTAPQVKHGSRVVSYLWEERILDRILPAKPHYLLLRRGLSQDSDALPDKPPIENADFVLLHINNLLGYGDRPPDWPQRSMLESRFEVIHTVWRGPMPVAWVYGRKG